MTPTTYLISRESGISTLAKFLKGMSQSRFLIMALNQEDIQNMKFYSDIKIAVEVLLKVAELARCCDGEVLVLHVIQSED